MRIFDVLLVYSLILISNKLMLRSYHIAWVWVAWMIYLLNLPILCNFFYQIIYQTRKFWKTCLLDDIRGWLYGLQDSQFRATYKVLSKTMWIILILYLFIFHLTELVIAPLQIDGISMMPSYAHKELVWVKKWPIKRWHPEWNFPFGGPGRLVSNRDLQLKKGQVILFALPQDEKALRIKRVIALENEHFAFLDQGILINNQLLNEPWLKKPAITSNSSQKLHFSELPAKYEFLGPYFQHAAFFGVGNSGTVPDNTVLVLGDNRNHSIDSRTFGFIPLTLVKGLID